MQELSLVHHLSNQEVVSSVTRCVQDDRCVTVRLLVHLGEMDARKLYRDHGCSTLFDYVTRKLHMSESEAMLRITVARLGRAYPVALEMLGRGELHLTALRLLEPVLTPDDLDLLHAARFQSKRQVQELLARHAPKPDVAASIRRLPEAKDTQARVGARAMPPSAAGVSMSTGSKSHASTTTGDPALPSAANSLFRDDHGTPLLDAAASDVKAEPASVDRGATVPRGADLGRPTPSASIEPLSPGRYKLTFTMSQRVRDKLREAQDLLRISSGDVEQVFERCTKLSAQLPALRRGVSCQGSFPRAGRVAQCEPPTSQRRGPRWSRANVKGMPTCSAEVSATLNLVRPPQAAHEPQPLLESQLPRPEHCRHDCSPPAAARDL
jgi:hypothetical protein